MPLVYPGLEFANLLWSTVLFAAIYVLAYRRYIFSLFDPFNVALVTSIFASVLMVNTVDDRRWWWQFFSFQLAFFLGFSRNKLPPSSPIRAEGAGKAYFSTLSEEMRVLEGAVALLFVVALAANLYLGATAGFPIFAGDAGMAKVSAFVGGLGAVKRVNDGIGVFVPCAALVLYACGRHKKWWLTVVLIEMILSCLNGSKSAVLLFVCVLATATRHEAFRTMAVTARLNQYARRLMAAAVLWAIAVLGIEGGVGVGEAAWHFLVRIVFSGDMVLHYYHPDVIAHFAKYGPMTYLTDMLNPILGFLRLVPYREPLGYTMVGLLAGQNSPDTTVGPNTGFYVAGHIYFGAVGGFFYSMTIGYLVSFVRKLFFSPPKLGVIAFVSLLTLSIHIAVLPIDAQYFVSLLLDTFAPVGAALAIYYLAVVAATGVYGHDLSREAHPGWL